MDNSRTPLIGFLQPEPNRLESSIKNYTKLNLLSFDEIGIFPIIRRMAKQFFHFIDMRLRKRSTILTTNVILSHGRSIPRS
ncbi:hypothetical protein CW304_21200 [Bacillus sp. UFRGS-B20]|nr:hypothetical protein CW304_21200 [Bacillus sp. UFRGS-B20]